MHRPGGDAARCGILSPAPAGTDARRSSERTSFGALFLLLPHLADAARWRVLTSAADRLAVAAVLAGPAVAADPLVRALLADPPGGADPTGTDALGDRGSATLDWLRGVLAIGPVEVGVHVVRRGRERFAVLVDEPTGHWLGLHRGTGRAAFAALLAEHPAGAVRAPRRVVGDMLRFLRPGDDEQVVTAANVLRRFAGSLPGFALAGAAHLWREALDVDAGVTETAHGWHVAVNRPPLAEILRICGHGDRTIVLPWQPDRAVRVEIGR